MNDIVNWREWLAVYADEPDYPFVARALEVLLADGKISAVWISGSRATRETDEHSDTDLRIHAPAWSALALAAWLHHVDPSGAPLVRLSKLGPAILNYECVFSASVAIDLLVFTGDLPPLAFDSVVFKAPGPAPLPRQLALQVVKETPLTPGGLENLMNGAAIDQLKFAKLFARGDRLGALFLLEAQRFALLRLAYIAARGVDCGAKPLHTLASLKLVRRAIAASERPVCAHVLKNLEAEGALADSVRLAGATIEPLFAELRARLSDVPSRRV